MARSVRLVGCRRVIDDRIVMGEGTFSRASHVSPDCVTSDSATYHLHHTRTIDGARRGTGTIVPWCHSITGIG